MRSYSDSVYAVAAPASAAEGLGALPQWRLDDLYEGMDSPRFAADLERAGREARAFAERWRGRLAEICGRRGRGLDARRGGDRLRGAAGPRRARHVLRLAPLRLRHQRRPARQVLWRRAGKGDGARGRSSVLRARAQPARRHGARSGDGDAGARPLSPMARGHPQGEAASARRRDRAIVPREVGLRRRRVEPPVRRDDVGAALRFRGREPDAGAAARQPPGPRRDEARGGGESAGRHARRQPAPLHADHQHPRQGQGGLGPLAQVRRPGRFAPSRQPGRARGGRGAGRRGHRRLSAPVAPLLRA